MTEETYLGSVVESAGLKAQYNEHVKRVLADKTILAWILKYTTREFNEYSIQQIVDCIEGTPEIGAVPMAPGQTNTPSIIGLPTEDEVPSEGKIYYDIRFYVILPNKERTKIIVNIEAQKNFYPGYDLVTRAIFYCARMLSAQLNTEFTLTAEDSNKYDNIKKVYSIWICMNSSKEAANTITEYRIEQNNIYGNLKDNKRYDLLSAVMVCLNEEHINGGVELHKMLNVLLSPELAFREKGDILSGEYDIRLTTKMKKEVEDMCNLADLLVDRATEKAIIEGWEKGVEEGIEKGIEKGEDKLAKLISYLIRDERTDDVVKVTTDKSFRAEMFVKYGIE